MTVDSQLAEKGLDAKVLEKIDYKELLKNTGCKDLKL